MTSWWCHCCVENQDYQFQNGRTLEIQNYIFFFTPLYTNYHGVRGFMFLWTTFNITDTYWWTGGPPYTSSEDNAGQNVDKGDWNTETASPCTLWNNSLLEKNPTAEQGIEPGNSWLDGNDITTEPSNWTQDYINEKNSQNF